MCTPNNQYITAAVAAAALATSRQAENREAQAEFNKQQFNAAKQWPEFEVKQCEGCGGRKSEYKNGVKVCAYCGGEK